MDDLDSAGVVAAPASPRMKDYSQNGEQQTILEIFAGRTERISCW